MNKFLVLLIFLTSLCSYANWDCSLSSSEKERLLSLSYDDFDQDHVNGWRVIDGEGCHEEAIHLIELYLDSHKDNLLEWQISILIWHAGQIYAFIDDYKQAKIRFEKNLIPNELPNDNFKWNAYVKGSIAFLEKDKRALGYAIIELEKATNPHSENNLKILKSFERCFDKPYREAYNSSCGI